jgi:predicted enzyme related to lactoylglutathione lyase
MEMTAYRPGVPSWVDLGSPDPTTSAAFYCGLFGWTAEEGPPETMGYRICLLRGRPVAGIGGAMEPGRPYWTTYINTVDAETTAKAVSDNGGEVLLDPIDVLTVGRLAICVDPSGARFSLWQPRDLIGAGLVNEPGAPTWNELVTRDTDTAMRFYPTVFGWGEQTHGTPPYTMWTLDGEPVAGMIRMGEEWPEGVPPHWMTYFAVSDVDATAARTVELGGTVPVPANDIEVGRFAVLNDPHGAAFSVISLKER